MKSHHHYCTKYRSVLMGMAKEAAKASQATRKKVGCIIYTKEHVTLMGFNGMPSGSPTELCEDDYGNTKENVLHSEVNAIKKATELGIDLRDAVCFVTMQPCANCAKLLVDNGISVVYYDEEYRLTEGLDVLKENNIRVIKVGEEGCR